MVETRDSRLLVEAAEAAAAAGDLSGAARLLCQLAELQHASLGPDHPELAHTLNNLGVVHEGLAQLDEAEVCYRRAHAIAVAALASDHPFVETSERNLREFCAAHGRAVDPPIETEPAAKLAQSPPPQSPPSPLSLAPAPDGEPLTPTLSPQAGRGRNDATPLRLSLAEATEGRPPSNAPPTVPARAPSPPRAPRRSLRSPLVAAVCIVLVVVAVLLARIWSESRAGAGFTGDTVRPAASPSPTPETATAPASPSPPPSAPPADVAATRPALPPTERPANTGSLARGVPAVVEARVCSRLSTAGPRWACQPVRESTGAGTLFFYTRLKSPGNAVVQHRWYHGERLLRTVELRVSANADHGYRTFSRQTITPARAGDWRVELRAQDGTLLGEERFTVRPPDPRAQRDR